MKAKKMQGYSTLKNKLDRVFSEWTRRSYSFTNGVARCVTCGTMKRWQEMQCGHFIPRHYLAGRWHPDNCFVQCASCNVFRRGNYPEFSAFLIRRFGAERIETLLALKRQPTKLNRADLQTKIDHFTAALKELDNV